MRNEEDYVLVGGRFVTQPDIIMVLSYSRYLEVMDLSKTTIPYIQQVYIILMQQEVTKQF